MATKSKKAATTAAVPKKSIAETRKELEEVKLELDKERQKLSCYLCGNKYRPEAFYISTDPNAKSGKVPICKKCAYEIAMRKVPDTKDEYLGATKESTKMALEYLDKPFVDKVWDGAVSEANNEKCTRQKKSPWTSYIKTISSFPQYNTMRWKDGDGYKLELNPKYVPSAIDNSNDENSQLKEEYRQNKLDVINLIGYDPFGDYPLEEDKPLLYATLAGLIDNETKEDMMKLQAVIHIVKKLNQAEKINKQIDTILSDSSNDINIAVLDKLSASSQKIMSIAQGLAKDNGIAVNFNNNKSKGANTLSGKIKDLNTLGGTGMREAQINMFDIDTCQGMLQVAEISAKARRDQIGYDENILQEMKVISADLVEKYKRERDEAVERARKLLVENMDLKEFLKEKKLVNNKYEVITYEPDSDS